MDNRTEATDLHKQGKFSNWKRKGKLSELDRLKKRQKELQIMKLSQEWDARRHKRKMDRIQWLQQRKDQVISQNESTETGKSSDSEASGEGQRANVPSKANNSPLSSHSTEENTFERTNEVISKSSSKANTNKTEENASNLCKVSGESPAENESSICSSANQVYKSVVVKTELLDSDRFSNSNYTSVSRQTNSRSSSHFPTENRKRRKKDSHEVRCPLTGEEFLYPSIHAGGKLGSSAYESLVNLVNSQPPLDDDCCPPASSVIAQAMKQSGLDEEEDEDMDDEEEPSLLMASEPVRFEDVLQGGGTNIQRLPTRSLDIMSSHGKQQDAMDKVYAHSRPHSRDKMDDLKAIRKDDNNPAYPKIKQCYSLMSQESSKASTPQPSPSSTHTGSPVTANACPSSDCSTASIDQSRNHPVAQATSTTQSCPPSGYLVPVYKPSADEVVYAFVPSSGDRVHPGHLRTSEVIKTSAQNAVYPTNDDRQRQTHVGYSMVRPPTAVIHHGRNPSQDRPEYANKTSYQHTNVTWVNAQSTSVREKRDPVGLHTAFSSIREVPENTTPTSINSHRHSSYHEPEVIMKSRQNPGPAVTMTNGYSPVSHNAAHLSDSVNNGPGLRSSPLSNPDTINNPTAVYVRPRLVPREIIVPYHAGSGNVPIVEYIKTDVICDKDLSNWTAQNVAEFISATDCSESAKIFIEQDIDGKAVLLLSQDIFVNRLNLKLGTAIKLYNHVANLRSALLM